MYNFDFDKLLKQLIPYSIRKSKLVSFFSGLLSFVKKIFNDFLIKVDQLNDRIRITGQVRVLRYELNNKFDSSLRRIEITDIEINSELFIFLESENQPVYLPNFISGAFYDFVVKIPLELQPQEVFIKDFLNTYKLAGKRYQIEYI